MRKRTAIAARRATGGGAAGTAAGRPRNESPGGRAAAAPEPKPRVAAVVGRVRAAIGHPAPSQVGVPAQPAAAVNPGRAARRSPGARAGVAGPSGPRRVGVAKAGPAAAESLVESNQVTGRMATLVVATAMGAAEAGAMKTARRPGVLATGPVGPPGAL